MQSFKEDGFTVLGAGSYGTAFAVALAQIRSGREQDHSNKVFLWGRNSKELELMEQNRTNNKYLPDVEFPDNLVIEADLKTAVSHSKTIFVVVPSHSYSQFLGELSNYLTPQHCIISCTKGLEYKTGKFLSSIIEQKCSMIEAYGVISGPSFALELAKGLPTALVLATKSKKLGEHFQRLLQPGRFPLKIEISDDVIGVQIGGAVKNIIAIAVGISDGLGYGSNTRTALITLGLSEIMKLATCIGAKAETIFGLSGLGDLILTCTDDKSRNRRFGLMLGRGSSIDQAIKDIGQVVEGYYNTNEVVYLAKQCNIEMLIVNKIFEILYQNKSVIRASQELLLSMK